MVIQEAKHCTFCGALREPSWRYCQSCGTQMPGMAANPSAPDPFALAWQGAQQAIDAGRFEDAERLLQELELAAPAHPDVSALKGALRLRQFRTEEAWEGLESALRSAPDSAFVHLKLAEYWLALGMPAKAREHSRQSKDLSQDTPQLNRQAVAMLKHVEEKSRLSFERDTTSVARSGLLRIFRTHSARAGPVLPTSNQPQEIKEATE